MGHYLQHMIPVETPEKLLEFVKREGDNIDGFLLSGGSMPNGKVPLKKFVYAIRWIKENTDLVVNIHTGLIDEEDLEYLKSMKPDHISFDVVGDTQVIRDIFGIKKSKGDYYNALKLLDSSGIPYSPHIIIGLDYGRVHWEFETIEYIASMKNFSNIVLLVLLPTPGTPMEKVQVSEDDAIEILKYTVENIQPEKVVLGCMRPRNMLQLERVAVNLKIKGIVLPSPKTIEYAESIGMKITRKNTCCVF